MPCILVEFAVAPFAVPPCHPVRDSDPEEDHPAPHDKLLVKTGFGDPYMERWVRIYLLETVGEGEVPVQSRLEPPDIIDEQAGLESMSGPG